MINRSVLVGRLTKDPMCRQTQSGSAIANFTIAVNRMKRSDEEQKADFISCVSFGKVAEYMEKYLKRGYLIGVDGRIQTSTYEKDGATVYVTQVVCDSVQNYEPRQAHQDTKESEHEASHELELTSDDLPF